MNKKMLASLVFSLLIHSWLPQTSYAMSWVELETQINLSEAGEEVDWSVVKRLVSIIDTLVIYTKQQQAAPNSLLFCPPEHGQFNLDEITSMIRARARKVDAGENESVAKLLIEELSDQYPCESSR